MSFLKRMKLNYGFLDNEAPPDKLISEGDLLIKELVDKQRNTTISLNEQLDKPKQFIKGSEIIPLSHYTPGTSSLSDVIASAQHFNYVEYLKAAGLSDQEVNLYLDNLNGFQFVSNKHKNWEKDSLKRYLECLHGRVEQHEISLESVPEQNQSKHKFVERGLTIKPDSIKTKLLKFALNNSQESASTIPQPIDNIIEIEKNRFHHLNQASLPSISKIRRKARKLRNRLSNIKREDSQQKSKGTTVLQSNSKWDVEVHEPSRPPFKTVEKKVYTCSPINYYTIKNNQIVQLVDVKDKIKTISKLSLEEIKLLPKFQDYVPGNPSKVLYLKNLNKNVKEEDLKQLFTKYHCNISEYKVMRGKLRGQAFVTFSCEDKACEALEDINGTILINKPVVIHFSSKA